MGKKSDGEMNPFIEAKKKASGTKKGKSRGKKKPTGFTGVVRY